MDKIKYSLFDLFSYLFPGFILINVFYLASSGINVVSDFKNSILNFCNGITTYFFIYSIVVAYCTGFVIQVLGQLLLLITQKIKPLKPITANHFPSVNNSVKYCAIREKSPANFTYIELWNVCSSFSANLAVVILLSGTYLKIKLPEFTWHIHTPFSVLLVCCFLYLAKQFNDWAIVDMDNTYKMILDDKPNPESNKNKFDIDLHIKD